MHIHIRADGETHEGSGDFLLRLRANVPRPKEHLDLVGGGVGRGHPGCAIILFGEEVGQIRHLGGVHPLVDGVRRVHIVGVARVLLGFRCRTRQKAAWRLKQIAQDNSTLNSLDCYSVSVQRTKL